MSGDLSNKATYPNFFRTASPDSFRLNVLVRFVVFMGFKKISCIYVDDQLNISEKDAVLQAVTDLNAEDTTLNLGVEVMLKVPTSGEGGARFSEATLPSVHAALDELKRSIVRVIFPMASSGAAYDIMRLANEKDMLSPGFVWVGSDGLSATGLGGDASRLPDFNGVFFIAFQMGNSRIDAFQDKWGTDMRITEVPEFENFTTVCAGGRTCASYRTSAGGDGSFDTWEPGLHDTSLTCTVFIPLAYDALITLAVVCDDILTTKGVTDPSLLTATDWMDGMKRLVGGAAFTGMSGTILFNENQERLMSMDILNHRVGATTAGVKVASWDAVTGFEWLVGSDVVWPGFDAGITIADASVAPFPPDVEMGMPPKCLPGEVFDTKVGECVQCPAGSYAPTSRGGEIATSCVLCPKGSFGDGAGLVECSTCPAGTAADLGSSQCDTCAAGSAAENMGSTECSPCKPGRFSDRPGSDGCTLCPKGEYNSEVNQTRCIACADVLGGATTELLGASTLDLCVCPERQFLQSSDSTACAPCPEGMVCEAGSDMRHFDVAKASNFINVDKTRKYPALAPQYWSDADDPLSVYLCDSAMCCPGGADWAQVCGEGSEGRSCAVCQEGWASDGVTCVPCNGVETTSLVFPVTPVVLSVMLVCALYFFSIETPRTWGSWANGNAALGFLLLSFYQTITLITSVPLALPVDLSVAMNFWRNSQDAVTMFRPQCTGVNSFGKKFALHALMPIGFAAAVLLTFAGSRVVGVRYPQVAMELDRVFNLYFSMLFAFFIAIASTSMSLLRCQENPNGVMTLIEDLSLICGSDDWNSLLAVMILCILVYCVGCGGLYTWAIISAPKRFKHEQFQKRWQFLFKKYNSNRFWWSVVILVKGVLLNLGPVIVRHPIGQLYWVIFVIMVYSVGLLIFNPWRSCVVTWFDGMVSWSISCVVSISALFYGGIEQDNSALGVYATFMTCLPFVCYPFVFAVLVKDAFQAKYMKDAYSRSMEGTKKTVVEACRSIGHFTEQDFDVLLRNLEEADRINLYRACVAPNAELHDVHATRLRSGASFELGRDIQRRISESSACTGEKEEVYEV